MGTKGAPSTNERIVQLLEDVRSELAAAKRRDERMARSLERLLKRKTV